MIDDFSEAEISKLSNFRLKIRRRKFETYQLNYSSILKGDKIEVKNEFCDRTPIGQIQTAIHFIQERLHIKSGMLRDVHLHGFLFRSMPVYDRGGLSYEQLHNEYKISQSTEQSPIILSHIAFRQLVHLLCKKGE